MTSTRTPVDDLADALKREGYRPVLNQLPIGWQCRLYNSVINGTPQAQGDDIYQAMDGARRHRDAMVAEGVYAKK